MYGNLNIRLEGCIFKYNQFQVVKMTDSANQNYMAIINNTSFYAITSNSNIHIQFIVTLGGSSDVY